MNKKEAIMYRMFSYSPVVPITVLVPLVPRLWSCVIFVTYRRCIRVGCLKEVYLRPRFKKSLDLHISS